MADLLGFGSQAQKWITDILLPQLEQIEKQQDATLEAVTQLRNDLDLHTRMATVERQVQHFKRVNQDIPFIEVRAVLVIGIAPTPRGARCQVPVHGHIVHDLLQSKIWMVQVGLCGPYVDLFLYHVCNGHHHHVKLPPIHGCVWSPPLHKLQ